MGFKATTHHVTGRVR